MSTSSYLLLLGSTADASQLQRAVVALRDIAELQAASAVVHGPSVVAGDRHHYVNQSLLLRSPLSRDALSASLKVIERRLGRVEAAEGCPIDIDLVAECGPTRELLWSNPAKLAHPLFRSLAAELCPQLG